MVGVHRARQRELQRREAAAFQRNAPCMSLDGYGEEARSRSRWLVGRRPSASPSGRRAVAPRDGLRRAGLHRRTCRGEVPVRSAVNQKIKSII